MSNKWWIAGLLVVLAVVLLSPLASPFPDGLERVAMDQGFIDRAQSAPYQLIADYVFPGIANETSATIMAGFVGVLIVFGLVFAFASLVSRRQKKV